MTELAKQFQVNLNELVGDNRAQVHIVHHDIDICINSQERELLYAIQELQKENIIKYGYFQKTFYKGFNDFYRKVSYTRF